MAFFVCFSTRVVHLEVCLDLSADAFLAAFTRFTERRGLPKTMFSDNGRNFAGANYKLSKEYNEQVNTLSTNIVSMGLHGLHMHPTWVVYVKQPSRA